MPHQNLLKVNELILNLAAKIHTPEKFLPHVIDLAYEGPCVEIDGQGTLIYLYKERGAVTSTRSTNELDEFLYWVFSDITSEMASGYAGSNKLGDQDFRIIYFEKQEELLGSLQAEWRFQKEKEHIAILKSQ